MEAVEAEAQSSDVTRDVLIREVQRYARGIASSFNVCVYFCIGYHLSRRVVHFLYRVHLGYADDDALPCIKPNASVVLLIKHLSNVD